MKPRANAVLCPRCGSPAPAFSTHRAKGGSVVRRYRRCVNDQCRHKFVSEAPAPEAGSVARGCAPCHGTQKGKERTR